MVPISDSESAVLRNNLIVKQVQANEIIHKEGSICDFEAYIAKGILRSYYLVDGNERIVHFHEENDWISDFKSLTLERPSKITIQAIEACELVLIKKPQMKIFSDQIKEWDSLGKSFFEYLFINSFNHLESLLIHTPRERYVYLLKNKPELIKRVPQYLVAQYIGVQPESLSRIRKRIADSSLS